MTEPTEAQKTALNIRIAELCGWNIRENHWAIDPQGHPRYLRELPDYTGSLDMMHEAEKALIGVEKYWQFGSNVRDVISTGSTGDGTIRCGWPTALHAEAWQRAVALDRTLSKEPIL